MNDRPVFRPSGFAIGIFLTALCLWAVGLASCVMAGTP